MRTWQPNSEGLEQGEVEKSQNTKACPAHRATEISLVYLHNLENDLPALSEDETQSPDKSTRIQINCLEITSYLVVSGLEQGLEPTQMGWFLVLPAA